MSWRQVAYLDEVATLSDVAPVDVDKSAAVAGSASEASRQDHKHDVSVGAPGTIGESDTPAEGTATSIARSDHVHGSPASWTPATHAPSHKSGGGDELLLNEFGAPTASIEINKQSLVNPVIDPQAADPATPVDGQVYYSTAEDHLYVYVAA